MNKRGQFFLAATFVIVGILIGLTTVANFVVVKQDKEFFYDLSKEVGFETKKVMDYGVYAQDEDYAVSLTEDFIANYSNYIGQDKVLFIYGDPNIPNNLRALVFQEGSVGSVSLGTGGTPVSVTIQELTGEQAQVSVNDGIVSVDIDGTTHEFRLRDGTNLFYVIKKEDGDDTLVAQG